MLAEQDEIAQPRHQLLRAGPCGRVLATAVLDKPRQLRVAAQHNIRGVWAAASDLASYDAVHDHAKAEDVAGPDRVLRDVRVEHLRCPEPRSTRATARRVAVLLDIRLCEPEVADLDVVDVVRGQRAAADLPEFVNVKPSAAIKTSMADWSPGLSAPGFSSRMDFRATTFILGVP